MYVYMSAKQLKSFGDFLSKKIEERPGEMSLLDQIAKILKYKIWFLLF